MLSKAKTAISPIHRNLVMSPSPKKLFRLPADFERPELDQQESTLAHPTQMPPPPGTEPRILRPPGTSSIRFAHAHEEQGPAPTRPEHQPFRVLPAPDPLQKF